MVALESLVRALFTAEPVVPTRCRTRSARQLFDTPRESTYFTLRDKSRTIRRQGSYLAFQLGKPGSSAPESSGFDVAIVRDGFIVELYTVLTDHAR